MALINKYLLILITSFFYFPVMAEVEIPRLSGPVVDQGGIFSDQARAQADMIIRKIHQAGGSQLQVLTLPSLDGEPIENVSIRVMDKWKIGDAKKDNGVLLLIAKQEKKLRIEVGQGLEGDLPDAYAKRIIEDDILPYFKDKQFDNGLLRGVVSIYNYTDKESIAQILSNKNYVSKRGSKSGQRPMSLLEFIFIALIIIIFMILRLLGGGGIYLGGGGGFGGGGGGSWSGGGGGFSGGGASGGW